MDQLLKLTTVLGDSTRFHIYQYITQEHRQVTVLEIANEFSIHPNVARLHLSKLENCHLLQSVTEKANKGGRPSRLYSLSDKVIGFTFPFRDYQLLSTLAIDTLLELGEVGKEALYKTGFKYGHQLVQVSPNYSKLKKMTLEQKFELLQTISIFAGLTSKFKLDKTENKITYTVHNCPFKELIIEKDEHHGAICKMHNGIFEGLTTSIFDESTLLQLQSMKNDCQTCKYELNFRK